MEFVKICACHFLINSCQASRTLLTVDLWLGISEEFLSDPKSQVVFCLLIEHFTLEKHYLNIHRMTKHHSLVLLFLGSFPLFFYQSLLQYFNRNINVTKRQLCLSLRQPSLAYQKRWLCTLRMTFCSVALHYLLCISYSLFKFRSFVLDLTNIVLYLKYCWMVFWLVVNHHFKSILEVFNCWVNLLLLLFLVVLFTLLTLLLVRKLHLTF